MTEVQDALNDSPFSYLPSLTLPLRSPSRPPVTTNHDKRTTYNIPVNTTHRELEETTEPTQKVNIYAHCFRVPTPFIFCEDWTHTTGSDMAAIGVQPQQAPQQQQQRRQYHQQMQQQHVYPNHSIMEDSDDGDDEEDSMEGAIDMNQAQFYQQQHQQQMYYQNHQQQSDGSGGSLDAGQSSRMAQHGLITQGDMQEGLDEEEYSDDDDESEADIPDENIDFSLTYAL